MVPSCNASLAPGAGQHLIGDILVAMHITRPRARPLPAALISGRRADGVGVGKISPITAVNCPPPASPPSTPGIVDKIPTFLGRSKGDTYTRSRLWAGLVLRDSPLGCYSTTIAHTHPAGCRAAILDYGFVK